MCIGITIHKGDVCNQQMLEHLFNTYNFSHVVHLSAKEGHQKSMEDPRSFIKANVECLLTLLKILARHKVIVGKRRNQCTTSFICYINSFSKKN